MNRKAMIERINELANRFTGCSGMYGIKGYDRARLAAMLTAFEKMTEFNSKADQLLSEHGYTVEQTLRFALMGDHAPDWYKQYWDWRMKAIEIWRSKF